MPVFVIAILLQVGAVKLNHAVGHRVISYAGQYNPAATGGWLNRFGDRLDHLILPTITLTLVGASYLMLYQRSAMLDVLGSDYVRTARAKGLRETVVLYRHVLRNALIPIVTSAGAYLPYVFMGSLVFESFFGLPGLGAYVIEAITKQDFAIVRTMVFLGSLLYIATYVLIDVVYTWVDPRVRLA